MCRKEFKLITNTHLLSSHNIPLKDYTKKFGNEGCGFVYSHLLPKKDPRFLKWKESLSKRPEVWNKGQTKETNASIRKLSKTFRRKKINNFAKWQNEMREKGLLISSYPSFYKNKNLAFLTGLVLGDGNITKYKRTEGLSIALGTDKPTLITYCFTTVTNVFNKKPAILHVRGKAMVRVVIYQKQISRRLQIPSGMRYDKTISMTWQDSPGF